MSKIEKLLRLAHAVKTQVATVQNYLVLAIVSIGVGAFFFFNCDRAQLGNLQNVAASNGVTAVPTSTPNASSNVQTVTTSTNACPASQVAIGLSTSSVPICVPAQPASASTPTSCPTGSSLISFVNPPSIACVTNSSWDQSGSICPVGQYLVSYTSAGAISCAPGTSTPTQTSVNANCPAGQYLNGIQNSQPVCVALPANTPTATVCATGTFLYDQTNSTPSCSTPPWGNPNAQMCSAGMTAIGWLGTAQFAGPLLCQSVSFASAGTNSFSCPAGQVLLSYSVTAQTGVCSLPPDPDLSHACPLGSNVRGTQGGTVVCQTSASGNAPFCPIGSFVTGLSGGQPVCTPLSATHLPATCPAGSYPIGTSNGALVCVNFSSVQMPTGSPPSSTNSTCVPNFSRLCTVPGGIGAQTCDASGLTFSACTADLCSQGYILNNGACTQISCVPGTSSACQVANGSGVQFCNSLGTEGACQVQACSTGYVQSGSTCTAETCSPGALNACSSGNAYGFQSCQLNGLGFNQCVFTSCRVGYTLSGQTCADTTPPRILFSVAPTDPTLGSNASLTFSAVDNESGIGSVACTLDQVAYQPCTNSVNLSGLSNGKHVFQVLATDVSGNSTTASVSWTSQVCATGSTTSCQVANGTGLASCNANGATSGTFGTCVATGCSAGYQLLNGQCMTLQCGPGYSVSGNQCVDNTPPTLSIISAPADPTIGTTASWQFSATDLGSGLASLTCQFDGGALPGNPTPVCKSPLALTNVPYGSHTLSITAIDHTGNQQTVTTSWHQFACVPGTVAACGIANGTGQETCNAGGTGNGACLATKCNNGYLASYGVCTWPQNYDSGGGDGGYDSGSSAGGASAGGSAGGGGGNDGGGGGGGGSDGGN